MRANIRAMTVAGFAAIFVGGLLPGGALNRQLRRTDAEASLLKRGVEGLLLSSATDWNGSFAHCRRFEVRPFDSSFPKSPKVIRQWPLPSDSALLD